MQLGCMPSRAWARSFWEALTPLLSAATAGAADTAGAGVHDAGVVQQAGAVPATVAAGQDSLQSQQSRPLPHGQLLQQQQHAIGRSLDLGYNATTLVRLVSATGKLPGHVPHEAQQLLMTASQQCLTSCSLDSVTALGLGVVRMHRRAARAATVTATKQHQASESVAVAADPESGRQLNSAKVPKKAFYQQVQQHAGIWDQWFVRSAELLQQQGGKQQQQQQVDTQHPQQHKQVAGVADSVDVSLQIFIAGQVASAVQPPDSWQQGFIPAVATHLAAMSLEQLSWVLWAVVRLRLEQQLPCGWLASVLHSCILLLRSSGRDQPAVLLRLHRAVERLRSSGVVHQADWDLWKGAYALRVNTQGLYVLQS